MTYGQIIGLTFVIFVLLAILMFVRQLAILLAKCAFEIMMEAYKQKKKMTLASEQRSANYKGPKNDSDDITEANNRIGFR